MNYTSSKSNWGGWSSHADTAASGSSPLFAPGLGTGPSVLNSSVKIRLAFLRKVYGILAAQLALTTLVSIVVMLAPAIQTFLFTNVWFLIVNLIGNVVTMFALMYKRNDYPLNFYLLGAFTLFNSISVGAIVSVYDLDVVVQALFLTSAIVIGLTVYTFNSKTDFTWMSGILSSLVMVTLCGSILHLFVGGNMLHTTITAASALIFAIYIIYDTQLIMKHLSPEEYIVGVVNLYVDIVNLFIKILRLLDQLKGGDEQRRKDERKRRS